MLTKTKIAFAALLVAGSASFAVAQDADPNLYNRYPVYNGVNGAADAPIAVAPAARGFQSAPVSLQQQRTGNGASAVVPAGRPQVRTFHYDSAPLVSGAGN